MLKELSDIIDKPARIKKEIFIKYEKLEECRRLAAMPQSISYDSPRVKASGSGSRQEKYAERAERILQEISALQRQRFYALEDCERLFSCPALTRDEKSVMIRRYMEGKSYPDIAADLDTSERMIYLWRKRAVEKLEKIITRDAAEKENAANTADQ